MLLVVLLIINSWIRRLRPVSSIMKRRVAKMWEESCWDMCIRLLLLYNTLYTYEQSLYVENMI